MSPLRHLWIALALWLAPWSACQATEIIEAWSYYLAPPFKLPGPGEPGLSQDLVGYLNQALKGRYEIRLVHLPRSRLDVMLKTQERAIVMFAPSVLYGTVKGDKYLWSRPLLDDRQELISRIDKPFQYEGPASLRSVELAGLRGHLYPEIARELDSGLINIKRYSTESALFSMLSEGRVDLITAAHSTYQYVTSQTPELKAKLVVSRKNLGLFTRHLMFMRGMQKERDAFDTVISRMASDPQWLEILRRYELEPAR